ncbi:hypothetical protein L6164_033070 [Bauhinia variegata]|uniref:Uncharacterized protein n=1 Tax=Bauhinia variegata TaxID=167791 RepID=A0ACB9KQR9_BAUVA|nr:hypothetical protein L6164_033070 [Bauhinia variegata]
MTRKKVKLQFIANDSARKSTFKKRKRGLLKKVSELSTLCGVEACAFVYSPYDPEPEIWPSPMEAQRVLTRFIRMPEQEKSKKMVNQEIFLRERVFKTKEHVKKLRKENREKELSLLMYQYLSTGRILQPMSMIDVNDLHWFVGQNIREINSRIEVMKRLAQPNESQAAVEAPAPAPALAPAPVPTPAVMAAAVAPGMVGAGERLQVEQGRGLVSNVGAMQSQQPWFMDLQVSNGGEEMLPFGIANHQNPFWPMN